MKLNKEQQKLAAENESLIYWFMRKFKLNCEEWYGLLAIELCNTVVSYNPDKGELSTYYHVRAFRVMCKEFKKKKALKRAHTDLELIDNYQYNPIDNDIDAGIDVNSWLESKNDEILNLRIEGYSQNEIADKLGMTQVAVSRHLKKMRDDFYGSVDR